MLADVDLLHEQALHLREVFGVTLAYRLIKELKSKITAIVRGT